jgi:endonuclease/exonuclease/phosphatase (EEP) superfamily protein YafD
MIGKTDADMVILLEASEKLRDAVASLPYPYRLDCLGIGPCDMIVLSRSRLLARQTLTTGDPTNSPILNLQTEIAGCRLTLIGTHMTRPWPFDQTMAQRYQADEIGAEVASWPGAKLVVGDFNAPPWGYVMRTIAREGRVSILTGGGGTWPAWAPPQLRIPIDHMLAGEGLTFVSRQVLPRVGSDHAAVLAEVAVTDQSRCMQR